MREGSGKESEKECGKEVRRKGKWEGSEKESEKECRILQICELHVEKSCWIIPQCHMMTLLKRGFIFVVISPVDLTTRIIIIIISNIYIIYLLLNYLNYLQFFKVIIFIIYYLFNYYYYLLYF